VLYGAQIIVTSIAMILTLNQHPYWHWNLIVSAFGLVTLSLGFFPRQSMHYAPLLWVWCLWLSMHTALADYWKLVDAGQYSPVVLEPQLYRLSVAAHVACGWATFLRPLRRPALLFVLSLLVLVLSAVVPKPRPQDHYLALAQSVAFVVLYGFANLVVELYSLNEGRVGNAVLKVLQSSWVLLIEDPLIIVITSCLQCMFSVVVLWNRAHDLDKVYAQLRRPQAASIMHGGAPNDDLLYKNRSDFEPPYGP
jgi:hypothetical protein